jgi:TPR repeat protein
MSAQQHSEDDAYYSALSYDDDQSAGQQQWPPSYQDGASSGQNYANPPPRRQGDSLQQGIRVSAALFPNFMGLTSPGGSSNGQPYYNESRSAPVVPSNYYNNPGNGQSPLPAYSQDYDPNGLDFERLRISSDPIPRGTSAMSNQNPQAFPAWQYQEGATVADPVARTGTSMSMNSAARRGAPPPRHAATMPFNVGGQPPAQGYYYSNGNNDAYSVQSFGTPSSNRTSGGSQYANSGYDASTGMSQGDGSNPRYDEGGSMPSYDNRGAANNVGYYAAGGNPPGQNFQAGYQQYGYNQQQQQQQQPQQPHPGYAASEYAPSQYSGYSGYSGYAQTVQAAPTAPGYEHYAQQYLGGGYDPHAGYGYSTDPKLQRGPSMAQRPGLGRAEGTLSDMTFLNTKKSKAIDMSHPPYTREYVEQYRQRIKGDPDPEVHFSYAKYLIEAAKKIGAKAQDQRAVRKYRELLLAEALKVIRRLATQGDAYSEAQFFLASCCGSGLLGLQVDHERAYHLYLQAAKQNHPAASYRVAVCNELGVGTRKDPGRAFAFYRKAASLGDTAAMYKLGMIMLSGSLGQAKNTREAVGWLKRAAEQADEENPHALHELGLLHEMANSSIVVHDEAYAKDLFTRAAQLGFVPSQYKLGLAYEYGQLGCPVDPKRSIAWYTKAAEKGDPEAELALSGWYLTGSEGVLPQSDAEAYLWAKRAAEKGLSKAEFAVGYYGEVGIGVKQDLEHAKRWYMRAAGKKYTLQMG